MTFSLEDPSITELVEKTLVEDIQNGDITTRNIFPEGKKSIAEVIAREPLILCGIDIFKAVFNKLSNKVTFSSCNYKDGDKLDTGETIIKVECCVIPMLEGERSALNILQWLSGVATLTHKYVSKAKPVKVLDTRKTTPGLRVFE